MSIIIKDKHTKITVLLLAVGIILLVIPLNISQPSFNGSNPGCDGGGCHTFQDGIVSVSVTDLQVEITVSGVSSSVAGELVDSNGTVVAFNNSTSNNPFTLNATSPGNYTVNAGHKSPLRWDSAMVNISVTDIKENNLKELDYALYENYPNPFNPSTVIRYSIPATTYVSLKVYDAIGNELTTLARETKPAGSYEVSFDARDLSSGVYFYVLKAGNYNETKKMILLK